MFSLKKSEKEEFGFARSVSVHPKKSKHNNAKIFNSYTIKKLNRKIKV